MRSLSGRIVEFGGGKLQRAIRSMTGALSAAENRSNPADTVSKAVEAAAGLAEVKRLQALAEAERMKTRRVLLAGMMLAVMTGCSNVPVANAPPTELSISQSWNGDYPVSELKRLPEGQRQFRVGYLGSAAAFESAWAAFKPGEALPSVDFGKHVVVFHRNVDFYNRTRIFKVTLEDGVADVLAMETRSAIPITDKVGMAMAVIPRAGVKSLQSGPASIPVGAE